MTTPLHAVYEILAKEVVYVYDDPAASQEVNAFLALAGYQINQTFNDPVSGFQALGLTSLTPDKPPVLLFRGTSELLDDFANTDPNGTGFTQFQRNRAAIATWLTQTAQSTGQKPDIVGHSLGGGIAQVAAAELTDQIGQVVTFNSPGTSAAIAAQFLAAGGANIPVTHYIVSGDFVSLGGEAFIAGNAILQAYTDPAINPIYVLDKHGTIRRLLTSPPAGYTETALSVATLNQPTFTYTNDSDYNEFLAAYGAIAPTTIPRLTSRTGVETLRTSTGFSYLAFVFGVRNALAPANDNFLVGDDQANTADGAGGNDTISGKGGRDELKGGTGNDTINGGLGGDRLLGDAGQDTVAGGVGQDTLMGGAGNDVLFGNSNRDRLTGVDPDSVNPGRGEVDRLSGGSGLDVFVLGNAATAFYNDGKPNLAGKQDYALITDFKPTDVIQLHGSAADYTLTALSGKLAGTLISLKTGNQPEWIGVVQGVAGLTLSSSAFSFV